MKNKKLIKKFVQTIIFGVLVISSVLIDVSASVGSEIKENINTNEVVNEGVDNRVVGVIYNEELNCYEGAGLRFKIFRHLGEANIIGVDESVHKKDGNNINMSLTEINVAKIKCKDEDVEYEVVAVEEGVFYKFRGLKELILPNAKTIYSQAFRSCSALEKIILPNVSYVWSLAFVGCDNIRYFELYSLVELEKLVQKNLLKIDINKFRAKFTKKTERFSDNRGILYELDNEEATAKILKVIDDSKLPEDLVIDSFSIYGLEYYITSVSERCFKGCKKIKNLTWSKNIGVIQEYVFKDCENLENIEIDNVVVIRQGAFENCKSLCKETKELIIPSGMIIIGDGVFKGCKNLKKIIIPESVNSIGREAFYDCHDNLEVIIPESRQISPDITRDHWYSYRDEDIELNKGPSRSVFLNDKL